MTLPEMTIFVVAAIPSGRGEGERSDVAGSHAHTGWGGAEADVRRLAMDGVRQSEVERRVAFTSSERAARGGYA